MTDPADPHAFLPLPHLPLHILLAMADGETSHGWGIIKRIRELTGGATAPSTGSLYLAIGRLEERGLLRSVEPPSSDEDARRRHYALTALGRRVLDAEVERLAGLVAVARAHGPGSEQPR